MMVEEAKAQIRKMNLRDRGKMEAADKAALDEAIRGSLDELVQQHQAEFIHAYIPLGAEVNISPLLIKWLAEGRKVICPRTRPKRRLENRFLRSLDELETGIMGTQHPAVADLYEGPYDLVVVPGLAFDRQGYRVGYGGAYYDTFLAAEPDAFKVGVFYPFQELPEVPRESHDVPLDLILTGLERIEIDCAMPC